MTLVQNRRQPVGKYECAHKYMFIMRNVFYTADHSRVGKLLLTKCNRTQQMMEEI